MKYLITKRLFGLGIIFFSGLQMANAQLTVVDNQTAQQLAETLIGQGVNMLNPVLTCPGIANGKFTGTSNLGIDSGIVLTSGRAMTVGFNEGVNGPNTGAGPSQGNNAPGDPDLTALAGQTTYDRCVLTFDFIPSGDTIKFDYVFGSTEYQSFSCTAYNDAFGFFISGPGIVGTQNMALIPGTNIPITVNSTTGLSNGPMCTNIGPGSPFSQYYVNNANGPTITYRGFTSIFTAIHSVNPCDTYHLKLAIADASDGSLDSGVFLKAGSLNSIGIDMSPVTTNGANQPLVPHCVRGCNPSEIMFSRVNPSPYPLTVKYLIEGTATMGTDFANIADSIIIPGGQTSAILQIHPLLVPTATGPLTVKIKALSPYLCGSGTINVLDSSIVTIYDSLFAHITSPPVTVCPNTEVIINAEVDSTLTYSWTPAALIPNVQPTLQIHPKPTVTTDYVFTATMPGSDISTCKVVQTYTATVEPVPQIHMPDDITICLTDSIDINAYVTPEDYPFNFLWSPSSYLRDNTSKNNKFFAPPGDYDLSLTASSPIANCSNTEDMSIHIKAPLVFDWISPADTTINYGDQVQLNSQSNAVDWIWDPTKDLSNQYIKDPMASPLNSTVYTLVGIDEHGCMDTVYYNINVEYNYKGQIPNAFTPNGDGLNDLFNLSGLKYEKVLAFKIFNRLGQLVFETTDGKKGWNGMYNGKPADAGVYFYYIKLVFPYGEMKEFQGDVTLIR